MNVFVDTWAWLALALKRDEHHAAARIQHDVFQGLGTRYVTTDFVLSETITNLYRVIASDLAEGFVAAVLSGVDSGAYQLVRVDGDRFSRAWELRRRYSDKPDVSFVDLTSMVVMTELSIGDVFTGDRHFQQVNLGFRLHPQSS